MSRVFYGNSPSVPSMDLLYAIAIHFTVYVAIETFLLDVLNNQLVLRYYYDEIKNIDIELVRKFSIMPLINIFVLLLLIAMYLECIYLNLTKKR